MTKAANILNQKVTSLKLKCFEILITYEGIAHRSDGWVGVEEIINIQNK
jgi:hypothetical protein